MPKYDNSGALFKTTDKKDEKFPDYGGSITVNGVEYWINGWIKDGKSGKFMSLSVKPKEQKDAPKSGKSQPVGDDIPF
jgi:hypothetical protein